MYEQLVPIIAPVILGTAVGFGWAKLGLPSEIEAAPERTWAALRGRL